MEQKVMIWIMAGVLGVAALGCLIWLVIWYVAKSKQDGKATTAPVSATPLVSEDECKALGKTLMEHLGTTGTGITSVTLQAMVKDIFTGIPFDAATVKAADLKDEAAATKWLQDNVAAALLLKQATDAFVGLDTDGSKSLNAAELKDLSLDGTGKLLVDLMDTTTTGSGMGTVELNEWIAGMGKGYIKNARNLMWAAGGADHKLTAEELTKALVWVPLADAETAAGTDKVFDLAELVKFVVKGMHAAGVVIGSAADFDKDDHWVAWVFGSVAKLAQPDPKVDSYEIAKLKDKNIDVPATTGNEKADLATFGTEYKAAILKAMNNPGMVTV